MSPAQHVLPSGTFYRQCGRYHDRGLQRRGNTKQENLNLLEEIAEGFGEIEQSQYFDTGAGSCSPPLTCVGSHTCFFHRGGSE